MLITGGAGFVGARLARSLLARGTLAGAAHRAARARRSVAGRAADLLADAACEARTRLAAARACRSVRDEAFDGVFHLASAVSGECEADFELGLRSNLDSTRALLDALRTAASGGAHAGAAGVLELGRGVRPDPALPLPARRRRRHAAGAADLATARRS